MRVRARRRVAAPPQFVWDVLTDHQGMSTWARGVSVTLERDGEFDRNGVGAVRRVALGRRVVREEVIAFEAPQRLAYRALSGMPLPDYRGEVTVKPRNGVPGSLIIWELTTSSSSRLVKAMLRVAVRRYLAALARAVADAKPGVLR
jgi:uncharacterized protein YndB with AHSA1/START domain